MQRYPLVQVDAFTTEVFGGNPCAVVFDADTLNDQQMLQIAREMNLSETAFVLKSSVADFGVRYFTPAEEIPLAGHPTIATVFALIDSGRLPVSSDRFAISLQLKDGPISVEIISSGGTVQRIVMTQRVPQFLSIHSPEDVLPVFGLDSGDLFPGVPIQTVSTGTRQLMVCVRDHDALRKIVLNAEKYKQLRARTDFFSPHLFTPHGITSKGATFARHFGVPPDIQEDPFTGSATGGMAAFLYHYGIVESPTFCAEQGHWMGRPGIATVELTGTPGNIESVKVGGSAVTVLRGELLIR